jgi:hypothetical protein
MRFLIHAKIPTEDGNKMVQDPNLLRKLEKYINKVKAEATYFFEADGNRVAAFIVDPSWLNRCLVEWVLMWSSTR